MESRKLADVTRRDRAIRDDAWIEALLQRAAFGALATVEDGQPFINVNLFAYDRERRAIYFHTARRGRTRRNIERAARVCFSVSEMGRLLPADTALNMSVEYASVIVFGSASVVADPGKAGRALQLLLDKYFAHLQPGRDYRPITAHELTRTSVYCIQIEQWSGKRKQVAADFPGAFVYE